MADVAAGAATWRTGRNIRVDRHADMPIAIIPTTHGDKVKSKQNSEHSLAYSVFRQAK